MTQFITKQTEAKYDSIKELQNAHLDASFVIGAESGGNVINVGIQLKLDKSQVDSAARKAVYAYLSDDANGDSLAATAIDAAAIGTDGLLISLVTGKCWLLVSEADGDIDVNLTQDATGTWYLILVMPNGRLVPSGAITFA
jgi:hypothetical protein